MRTAHILRTQTDCTNNGISGKRWMFRMITEEEEMELQTNEPDRYLVLVKRELWGEQAWYLRPLNILKPAGSIGPMHGGNYAEVDYNLSRLPLPIHDRFETPEEYHHLSI